MRIDHRAKEAYELHTIPNGNNKTRERIYLGEITNLDKDLEELKITIEGLTSPGFDFTGSCLKPNSIGIRIFDSNKTIRVGIDSGIDPDIIKEWMIKQGVAFRIGNSPFSLTEDYKEHFSAKIFRLLVPIYDKYIEIRFGSQIQKK